MSNTDVRVIVWNIAWRRASSAAGKEICRRIFAEHPDVVILTEAHEEFFGDYGHTRCSAPDYGYPMMPGRRKVLIWNLQPWHDADQGTACGFPPGRYVEAVTTVKGLLVRAIGVCVPWRDAHVRSGRQDSAPWQEHISYLEALQGRMAAQSAASEMLIIGGDFNQHIPRRSAPHTAYEALVMATNGLVIATSGRVLGEDGEEDYLIDHVLHRRTAALAERQLLSRKWEGGDLSDHPGVAVTFTP